MTVERSTLRIWWREDDAKRARRFAWMCYLTALTGLLLTAMFIFGIVTLIYFHKKHDWWGHSLFEVVGNGFMLVLLVIFFRAELYWARNPPTS